MLWMKRNAYEESTIKKTATLLKHLLKHSDFNDPEQVKDYVAHSACFPEKQTSDERSCTTLINST